VLTNGTNANVVGGATAAARNVISGNSIHGVMIAGDAGITANLVIGNYIGTNSVGSAAIPNGGDGILIQDGPGNAIGGAAAGEGNVISGNAGAGIRLGTNVTGTTVRGNIIGLNAAGASPLSNGIGVDLRA